MKKIRNNIYARRVLTVSVQGALAAMFAAPMVVHADDEAALKQPTNFVEIGAENVGKDSAKFGEYNGLDKKQVTGVSNFSVRGGDAYQGGDGTTRWKVSGTDLGTTSRELGADAANQGLWNLGLRFDQLRHNISDTYQTPFQGSMGGNTFTLPKSFGVINTAFVNQVTSKGGTQDLSAAQQASFLTKDVHSDRKNSTFTSGYNFDRQWAVKFDYNQLEQTGAKLISPGTDAGTYGTFASGYEKTLMLMNPTNYKTDTFNLALNWKGDVSYFSASYYASFFKDRNNGLNFSNPFLQSGSGATATAPLNGTAYAGEFPVNTLSTAPNNELQQVNLNGGYNFSPTLKLVGGLSYSKNWQNREYPVAVMQVGGLPQGSLNGLVETKHADLKLTDQADKDLTLTAGVKYNKHDNQTASNIYKFLDLGGANVTSVNTPMSNSKAQVELAGDYRINDKQRVHLGYEYENVQRWCNNALANTSVGAVPSNSATYVGAWTNSSCAQVPQSQEDKAVLGYKLKVGDSLNFNAGYSYGDRVATINQHFYNPMQGISAGYELLGWTAYFEGSRTEQTLKAGANWEPNDKLSVGLNGRYLDDKYGSTLGVQKGSAWSLNLDSTYNYSANNVVSAYVTLQNRQRDMLEGNGLLVPGTPSRSAIYTAADKQFTNQMKDADTTLGLNAKQKGLLAGKLELGEDLSYSTSKTGYSTQIPYFVPVVNGTISGANTLYGIASCTSSPSLTCGSTPDIKNQTLRLKVNGNYQVNKQSKIALGYLFQKQKVTDYYYNVYQYGYTSTGLLHTNEQAPNYTVNAVSATYIYTF